VALYAKTPLFAEGRTLMALHVAKSVERSLRFSAFLSVRPKFISWHPIGCGCATQPVNSCRGARFMGMRAAWPA
jgi:hypothetical protein